MKKELFRLAVGVTLPLPSVECDGGAGEGGEAEEMVVLF